MMPSPLVPVAQYLRISTEEQPYSLATQRDAIAQYAEKRGCIVTKSYEDAARSGVSIKRRKALQALLQDVMSGSASFKAILVYDVSRWGRFQDCDEGAHYEFLCKQAGVPVHYCEEEFSNDGTAQSSIFKALKRTMAGEYSRDLSVRGYAGRKRTVLSGYRPGGPAGYGLRRMAVSAEGKPRRILRPGERKPFPTDRVTLVLGPAPEVTVMRRIFETFLRGMGKLGPNDIARQLNRECIPSERGGMWTHHSVWGVLTNPKYAGRLVWGRTTQQLQTNSKPVPEGSWVVREKAFEPIVSANIFTRTQTLLHKRSDRKIPEAELIRSLKRVLSKHGHLSEKLFERAGTHAFCTYQRRFGSAQRAYDLAGYRYPAWTFARAASAHNTVRVRNSILSRILTLFPGRMTAFNIPRASRRTNLLLDGKFKRYVWVAPH